MPNAEDFRRAIREAFAAAQAAGRSQVLVVAGDLHKMADAGHGPANRMPTCCAVMYKERHEGDLLEYAPPSGYGPRLAIRYRLPRPDASGATPPAKAFAPLRPRPVASPRSGPPTPGRAPVAAEPVRPSAAATAGAPILVVLSCTKKKAVTHPRGLVWEDFGDPVRRDRRTAELAEWALPARRMYGCSPAFRTAIGAVDHMRRHLGAGFVDVRIVSAGYGLIEEGRMIAPYDATFHGRPAREVAERGLLLGLPGDGRAAADAHPLSIFLLGQGYLQAVGLPGNEGSVGRRLYLTAEGAALPRPQGATLVRLGADDMARLHAGQVTLKAQALGALAHGLVRLGPGYVANLVGDGGATAFRRAMEEGLS